MCIEWEVRCLNGSKLDFGSGRLGVIFHEYPRLVLVCVQVAMGQGQADIALQLLHDCGRNGEWLCLKNLHLVTAWLPVLEKVSTS